MSDMSELVDELISLDGSEQWKLHRDGTGRYIASVKTLGHHRGCESEDRMRFDKETGQYWVQGRVSGPFKTIEAAQHDALDNLPWFFEALTSDTNGS